MSQILLTTDEVSFDDMKAVLDFLIVTIDNYDPPNAPTPPEEYCQSTEKSNTWNQYRSPFPESDDGDMMSHSFNTTAERRARKAGLMNMSGMFDEPSSYDSDSDRASHLFDLPEDKERRRAEKQMRQRSGGSSSYRSTYIDNEERALVRGSKGIDNDENEGDETAARTYPDRCHVTFRDTTSEFSAAAACVEDWIHPIDSSLSVVWLEGSEAPVSGSGW